MSCWNAINLALDKVLKDFVPTSHAEILVIAYNEQTLPALRERVTNYVSPISARFNYLSASKLTANTIRGRTRLMVIKEAGAQVPADIESSIVRSLLSASRNCIDVEPEDLIFTV